MDCSNNNFNNYNDDNIRPADKVITEQLIENTKSDFDKHFEEQFKKALYLSRQELNLQEELNSKYEEEVIQNYYAIICERKNKFNDLKNSLNKLVKFDKEIKEIYEIIKPIIESYCAQYIEYKELDANTYDKIFKVLATIRPNKTSIELLKLILIRNET